MVLVLPNVKRPSFSQSLGASLGKGISEGISKVGDFATQLGLEKMKMQQRQNLLSQIEGGGRRPSQPSFEQQVRPSPSRNLEQEFLESLPSIEQEIGRELTQEDLGKIWDVMSAQNQMPQPQDMYQAEEDPYARAKMAALSGEHDLSRVYAEEGKQRAEELAEERKEERKGGQSLLEKRNLSRENLLQRQQDYKIAKEAILRNPSDISSVKNFLSDRFNLPGLKSAPAAIFSAAMKDAFVQSIKAIPGARPNMWVEQQIQSALARVGMSDEANLSALEIGQFKLDMEEAENNFIDELESEAEAQGRNLTGKDKKELYRRMKGFVDERQKELGFKLKTYEEKEWGPKKLRENIFNSVPKGTILTPEAAEVLLQEYDNDMEKAEKAAIRLGYDLPSEELLRKMGYE